MSSSTSSDAPLPYVVLIGDAGAGKSTVVEKITGEKNRSSAAKESVTKSSEMFHAWDGSLIVCDTPGSNAMMEEKVEHNVWIAGALNRFPLSKILIIVKADTRLESVVRDAGRYLERFLDLDPAAVGVLVTHMDAVGWTAEDCRLAMRRELGCDAVVFSGLEVHGRTLLRDIHAVCGQKRHDISVDSDNFLKLFKMENRNVKILRCTAREVEDFKARKKSFDEVRKDFPNEKDQVDLIFEFQAYMREQIEKAKVRMAKENNFTFYGEEAYVEAGHLANMTNQLVQVLRDLRIEACRYQSDAGVNDLRKCPHCGLIWAKVVGCEGATTCGELVNASDLRSEGWSIMATFKFVWDWGSTKVLNIVKSGQKEVARKSAVPEDKKVGCGNRITWSSMARVPVPDEFAASAEAFVRMDDVRMLPPTSAAMRLGRDLDERISRAGSKMKVKE